MPQDLYFANVTFPLNTVFGSSGSSLARSAHESDMSSHKFFTENILTNDLLFQIIFDASSPAALLCLSRTCRRAHTAVNWYIPLRFDVNRYISPYFSDYLAFRTLQAHTGTLISGSTALQFFAEEAYADADLDLYVPPKYKQAVCRFITADGYTFKPHPAHEQDFETAITKDYEPTELSYQLKGITNIFTFAKETKDATKSKQVQVIVAENAPMEVILNFHSTVVMNVIAWDRAYCLYPRGTLVDHCTAFTRPDRYEDSDAIRKYEGRGWRFIPERESPRNRPWLPLVPRWIGDGHSWMVRLSTKGVTPPPPVNDQSMALTRDPCAGTTWDLCVSSYNFGKDKPTEEYAKIEFDVLLSQDLDYGYVVFHVNNPFFIPDPLNQALLDILERQKSRVAKSSFPSVRYYDEDLMQYIATHLERGQEWSDWKDWE